MSQEEFPSSKPTIRIKNAHFDIFGSRDLSPNKQNELIPEANQGAKTSILPFHPSSVSFCRVSLHFRNIYVVH